MKSKEKLKLYTLEEIKDLVIGLPGTPAREEFEHEQQLAIIGYYIQVIRKKKNITQDALGTLVGVKKSWISKLENSAGDVTFETFIKVLKALKVKLSLYFVVNGQRIDLLKNREKEIADLTVNGLLKVLKLLDKSAMIGMQVGKQNLQVA
jgi:HTH-type transcriptional regulator / antitoxin HipB